jgi:hypothetical protein
MIKMSSLVTFHMFSVLRILEGYYSTVVLSRTAQHVVFIENRQRNVKMNVGGRGDDLLVSSKRSDSLQTWFVGCCLEGRNVIFPSKISRYSLGHCQFPTPYFRMMFV